MILVASCIPIPFSVLCDDCLPCFFVPLVHFMCILHTSLHVYAWVLLVSVSSILQHNQAMDIQSKPTFVPHKHHLLFAILLVYPLLVVCYLACLSFCSHLVCYAYHCYLACSFCAFLLLSMHLSSSIARLLASCLILCMYTHGARIHGARSRSSRRKQKGRGCKLANISRAAVFSRFRV